MVFKFATLALLPFIIGHVMAADLFFDLPVRPTPTSVLKLH
jgi:hypothetical protein